MKLTNAQIKHIIREELRFVLSEESIPWEERVDIVTGSEKRFSAAILEYGSMGRMQIKLYQWSHEDSRWENEARVHIQRPEYFGGKCYNAWEVIESAAVPDDGWGPIAYDIAMEFAGKDGLMADRDVVSDEAHDVWLHYLKSRSDVSPKQHPEDKRKTGSLDWEDAPFITPDNPEDDCSQDMFIYNWNKSRFDPGRYEDEEAYIKSPLTKAFVKKGGRPIIDGLMKAGRLRLSPGAKRHLGIEK